MVILIFKTRDLIENSLYNIEYIISFQCWHHLKGICENHDADGLEDWRGFCKRQLLLLDDRALNVGILFLREKRFFETKKVKVILSKMC